MSIEQLKKDWEAFEQRPFPAAARQVLADGTNLVMLHSDAASVIIATFQTNGQLSTRMRNQLSSAIQKLQALESQLDSGFSVYYKDLLGLAQQAQKYLTK